MYLSRVRVKLTEKSLEYFDGLVKNNSYATHQLLWNLFPNDPDAKRDFLFRAEQEEGWPLYYVLSKRTPVNFSEMFSIQTKSFNPDVEVGQLLLFDLRANPVVARRVEGKKNSVHHDVWMDAKYKAKQDGLSDEETDKLKHDNTKQWLINRSELCGFDLEQSQLQIISYQQYRATKHESNTLYYSTVDYRGILKITDTEKFRKTLENGIGRSKAFGCGLMLIRPCKSA